MLPSRRPLVASLSAALLIACGTPSSPVGAPEDGGSPSTATDAGADGGVDAGPLFEDCLDLPVLTSAPATLSETGLYADGGFGPGVREFRPAYALWSDGTEKRRFALLPCTPIGTSDMDHWVLQPGTRLWKEFSVDGGRLETRLIARTGPGANDFFFTSYVWDGGEAYRESGGVPNVGGSEHDVPSESQCRECHGLLRERALGFSAIQLSHGGPGLTFRSLADDGLLGDAGFPEDFPVPGDAVQSAALGYLHANCGGCHHPDGIHTFTDFHLRLLVSERAVGQTGPYRTAVGKGTTLYFSSGIGGRIVAGDPDASAVHHRMARRDFRQMPPLGTEVVDAVGLGAVRAWISSLDGGS